MWENLMDSILDANLLVLSKINPPIYSRFCNGKSSLSRYSFQKARSGETVPAIVLAGGNAQPLHSLVDPRREAERLISTITGDTGFVVFLGLGGGFAPEAMLERRAVQALVIDFCLDGIAELFSARDYTKLLNNERFSLLLDPSNDEIKNFILERYCPSLCGGIQTIPLRTRTALDTPLFDAAFDTIKEAVKTVSADYSVQAHFGSRWFSNIIRNIKTAGTSPERFTAKWTSPIDEAAIVAAGPSLDRQIHFLAEFKSRRGFIISSDTALPVLLHHGIKPDAVVSIDCQHISYYHFIACNKECELLDIPLILDIASPPLLSRFSHSPLFFSSGHPLALYASRYWWTMPHLDTSGGNVTYACLSFAESLGAGRITLFGADFSYVNSRTYARGTYIYPFFEKRQNRLSPTEAQLSAFLYRSPFLPPENTDEGKNYYETSQLRFYRKKLEEKAATMNAQITAAQGYGAPVNLAHKTARNAGGARPYLTEKEAKTTASDFLERYHGDIAALPEAGSTDNYMQKLNEAERQVFITLLPCAAAIKRRSPHLKTASLIEEVRRLCIQEIERALAEK
jgi:hypothetical protein